MRTPHRERRESTHLESVRMRQTYSPRRVYCTNEPEHQHASVEHQASYLRKTAANDGAVSQRLLLRMGTIGHVREGESPRNRPILRDAGSIERLGRLELWTLTIRLQ